jgi:lipid-A-disaccharide synthase
MRYVIVTGEISGDKIGTALTVSIMDQDHKAEVYAMGGRALKHAGAVIVQNTTDLAVMGLTSLPKNLIQIRQAYHQLQSTINRIKPDVIIYVDFAGFNLRLGRWTKNKGYKNIYIAPPKTWASRAWRNKAIQRDFDLLITLFPFANDYFNSQGHYSLFLGHPLLDSLPVAPSNDQQNSILIAPGSRAQEIKSMMPVLSAFMRRSPQYKFLLSKVPGLSPTLYNAFLKGIANVTISEEPLQHLLPQVSMAIITSGTATLEAAIIGTPQVVIYKTSAINFLIAKRLIKSEYISLPNLLLNKSVVPELIQQDLTVEKLTDAIKALIDNKETIMADYTLIKEMYDQHNPSDSIATTIIDHMSQNK